MNIEEIKKQHEKEQTPEGRQKALVVLGANQAYAKANKHRGELIRMVDALERRAVPMSDDVMNLLAEYPDKTIDEIAVDLQAQVDRVKYELSLWENGDKGKHEVFQEIYYLVSDKAAIKGDK